MSASLIFSSISLPCDQIQSQEISVGDEVSIPAGWMNILEGRFHNYAEVDIYHASNMNEIVWAGAAVGNVDAENSVTGEFLNTRSEDPFTERWSPKMEGKYVLKYYLDPEKAQPRKRTRTTTSMKFV